MQSNTRMHDWKSEAAVHPDWSTSWPLSLTFESFAVYLWKVCVTRLSLQGRRLRQITAWLPQIKHSGWQMAFGMMYGCCFLATGPRHCVCCAWSSDLRFLCVAAPPWSPDMLPGCKHNPYKVQVEWWESLSTGQKSDSLEVCCSKLAAGVPLLLTALNVTLNTEEW